MNKFVIAAVIGASAWLSASSAQAPVGSKELGMIADVTLPDDRGREFRLLHGSLDSKFRIGCDGSTTGNLGAQVIGDVQSFISYFQNNVSGLAVNFLIYASPTLYQLLENLNIHKDFLRDLNAFNCSSVREMAADRRNQEISAAKDKCAAAGEAPGACDDAGTLKRYMPEALQDLNNDLKRITNVAGDFELSKTVKEYVGRASTRPPGASASSGAPVRQDESATELEEIASSLRGDIVAVENGGSDQSRFEYPPPAKRVNEAFDERVPKYVEWLDAVTDAANQGGNMTQVEAYRKLQNDPAFPLLDQKSLANLANMKKAVPVRYDRAKAAVARRLTLAYMRYAIAYNESVYANIMAGGSGAQMGKSADEVMVHMERDIARMKAELNLEEVRVDNANYIKELERALINM